MWNPMPDAIPDDFWNRVRRMEEEAECWPWQRGLDTGGYGQIHIEGTTYRPHRIAYFLHYGVDPEHQLVMHLCNNRPCCNPRHLKLGTQSENLRQARDEGRFAIGELNGRAKLTDEDVRAIRFSLAMGLSRIELSVKYNVNPATISRIKTGKNWKHA